MLWAICVVGRPQRSSTHARVTWEEAYSRPGATRLWDPSSLAIADGASASRRHRGDGQDPPLALIGARRPNFLNKLSESATGPERDRSGRSKGSSPAIGDHREKLPALDPRISWSRTISLSDVYLSMYTLMGEKGLRAWCVLDIRTTAADGLGWHPGDNSRSYP
jgi:hypothetical protein